ncbi:uncharacterized protein LOC122069028 [Macadamia integrifolia]|uniref:uncharacterized protein LOC122069028 n=1 Tax=Macadamia integrifolia TaxID=60698 RepID=UPI001C4F98C7|nr:uncharacterized protein LOC122069028 [Macadamia integrifolia]XP_042488895.1 uncharacterized protein LOC122069028 [Macadamia integrifolia]
MGFNSVFISLQEVFPQVDIRVLKAVAIEHPKDPDAAVECILSEVLPCLPCPTESHRTQPDCLEVENLIVGEEEPELQRIVEGEIAGSPSNSRYVVSEDDNYMINTTDSPYDDSKIFNEEPVGSLVLSPHGGNGDNLQTSTCRFRYTLLDQPSDTETEELIPLEKSQNDSVMEESDQGSLVGYGSLIEGDCFPDCCNDVSTFNIKDFNEVVDWYSSETCGVYNEDQSCLDADSLEVENLPATSELIPSSEEETSYSANSGSLSVKVGDTISDFDKPDPISPSENVSAEKVFDTEVAQVENGSSSIVMASRSSQIGSIDLLEESIGEAKNNKKTLFLAMQSIINTMKELEFQEAAAEQAKREAARCDLDIPTKVEDLRQILQHAKEANNMHSGEVYGEKAILTTEVRELQSRIQNLSDERDQYLAILKEMSQTLEIRLAAAEEEIEMAKQDKLEKEKLARVALAEQELAMEMVVEESKRLQQQAEDNSKLRDFLVERGSVVDILQGEIAVIFQDVKLLKEMFDGRVPISKSLSSSQTSCLLASSSSSIKNLGYDRVPENVKTFEDMEKTCPAPSVVGQVQKSSSEKKTSPAPSVVSGDAMMPLDDGWEFFDDDEVEFI